MASEVAHAEFNANGVRDAVGAGGGGGAGAEVERHQRRCKPLPPLLLVLIVLAVGDAVLAAILLDQYTEVYAQYINIATAFCYLVASSLILLWRRWRRPPAWLSESGALGARCACASPERRGQLAAAAASAPWYCLVPIGLLNGGSNFFLAIAQPHTANLTQSLLGLLGLPLVIILSFLVLRCKPSSRALLGAALILCGSVVSALRGVINHGDDSGGVASVWYSVILYIIGILILAAEKVFEDKVFGDYAGQDAMEMFWCTMLVQFFLYFPLLPTQMLPELGGLNMSEIPQVTLDGIKCTFGITSTEPEGRGLPACSMANTALLLSYVVVDMSFYFCSLYVIQKHGANLMATVGSVAIPLQQVVFCTPFLVTPKYADKLFPSDVLALLLVCCGLYVYQWLSPEGREERGREGISQSAGEHLVS